MSARPFGLDIGRYYIKVVSAEASKNKRTLKAAAIFPGHIGGILTESTADLSNLSQIIKKGVKSAKVDSNKCIVSLMESQIVSRMIQMPVLSQKELTAAINYEAEQYIPLPLKDVVLQYKILNQPKKAADAKMDVFLVAAPKRVVEKYLKVVKDAGLDASALETESTALVRSLIRHGDPPTIIISIGAVSTELVIVIFDNVFFTRSVPVGGAFLTKAIMEEFNLPLNQAEQYKRTYGVLEDKVSGRVARVIGPHLDTISGEILRAVEFAGGKVPNAPISRVVVTGGGAFLPGLSEFLAQRTGLEISTGDPWSFFEKNKLAMSLSGQGSTYSVATGLALRM